MAGIIRMRDVPKGQWADAVVAPEAERWVRALHNMSNAEFFAHHFQDDDEVAGIKVPKLKLGALQHHRPPACSRFHTLRAPAPSPNADGVRQLRNERRQAERDRKRLAHRIKILEGGSGTPGLPPAPIPRLEKETPRGEKKAAKKAGLAAAKKAAEGQPIIVTEYPRKWNGQFIFDRVLAWCAAFSKKHHLRSAAHDVNNACVHSQTGAGCNRYRRDKKSCKLFHGCAVCLEAEMHDGGLWGCPTIRKLLKPAAQ